MEVAICRAEENANDIKWPCIKGKNGFARIATKRK